MAPFQVTCHTPDDINAERRIRGLGGEGWWFPTDSIIQIIEDRQHEFWVSVGQQRIELVVRRHGETGSKYLTTETGEFPPRSLLNLPACLREDGLAAASDRSRWAPAP